MAGGRPRTGIRVRRGFLSSLYHDARPFQGYQAPLSSPSCLFFPSTGMFLLSAEQRPDTRPAEVGGGHPTKPSTAPTVSTSPLLEKDLQPDFVDAIPISVYMSAGKVPIEAAGTRILRSAHTAAAVGETFTTHAHSFPGPACFLRKGSPRVPVDRRGALLALCSVYLACVSFGE